MRIDALLAQHGDLGSATDDCRRSVFDSFLRIFHLGCSRFWYINMQSGVIDSARRGVFCIGAGRVVALLGDFPAHGVPDLVEIGQLGAENAFGIAPDL